MQHSILHGLLSAAALLGCISCASTPRESRETVYAVLVYKTPISVTDARLEILKPNSTWLVPCIYRVLPGSPGDSTNRYIGVFHEGIERWRISARYSERTVGTRYRLTIGPLQDYPDFQVLPRDEPQTTADLERALQYDWYFDLDEASFSLQKLKADYRMWNEIRGIKP